MMLPHITDTYNTNPDGIVEIPIGAHIPHTRSVITLSLSKIVTYNALRSTVFANCSPFA
jgi:hypothetical protein